MDRGSKIMVDLSFWCNEEGMTDNILKLNLKVGTRIGMLSIYNREEITSIIFGKSELRKIVECT